jgi:hypothetical protein
MPISGTTRPLRVASLMDACMAAGLWDEVCGGCLNLYGCYCEMAGFSRWQNAVCIVQCFLAQCSLHQAVMTLVI